MKWNGETHLKVPVNEFSWLHNADLAVFKLKTPVEFSVHIQPVQLASNSHAFDSYLGQTGTVVGWGGAATTLQFAEAQFTKAQPSLLVMIPFPGNQKHTVGGDSGSPVVIYENGTATQVGVHVQGWGNTMGSSSVGLELEWISMMTNATINN